MASGTPTQPYIEFTIPPLSYTPAFASATIGSASDPLNSNRPLWYSHAGSPNMTWTQANTACQTLTDTAPNGATMTGGWRLPTQSELQADVAVWKTHPPTGATSLWSNTPSGSNYVVIFAATPNQNPPFSFPYTTLNSVIGFMCVR